MRKKSRSVYRDPALYADPVSPRNREPSTIRLRPCGADMYIISTKALWGTQCLFLSLAEAREWLRAHGYLWQSHRSTAHFRRFIQAYDVRGASFRSKKLPNGAVLVWQRW